MFNKQWFYRKGSEVKIDMDTDLTVDKPVFIFSVNLGLDAQAYAEMLKERLNEELRKAKAEIAKTAWHYLDPKQTSALKKKLRNWDSKKGCWK